MEGSGDATRGGSVAYRESMCVLRRPRLSVCLPEDDACCARSTPNDPAPAGTGQGSWCGVLKKRQRIPLRKHNTATNGVGYMAWEKKWVSFAVAFSRMGELLDTIQQCYPGAVVEMVSLLQQICFVKCIKRGVRLLD